MGKDPVCSMQVDPKKAAGTSEYQGKTWYSCSAGCQAKVRSEPRAVRKPLTEAEAPECVGSFVAEAQSRVQQSVKLKPGYLMVWGGLFEHLDSGRARLRVAPRRSKMYRTSNPCGAGAIQVLRMLIRR